MRSSPSASYECWRLDRIDFLRALTALTRRQFEVCRKTLLLRLLMWSKDPFINSIQVWCMFVRASLCMSTEESQLDATVWFIALIICSTCFGRLYAHHQELDTILVLLLHMVCNALVAATRLCVRDEGSCSSSFLHPGRIACWPASDHRPPATKTLHTIRGNNTSIISSAWWWTYKCPKILSRL